jgi:hypothetical protein
MVVIDIFIQTQRNLSILTESIQIILGSLTPGATGVLNPHGV